MALVTHCMNPVTLPHPGGMGTGRLGPKDSKRGCPWGRVCLQGPQAVTRRKSDASRGHPVEALSPALGVGPFGGPEGKLQPEPRRTRLSPARMRFHGNGSAARHPAGCWCAPSISMAPITMAPTCSEKHGESGEQRRGRNPLPAPPRPAPTPRQLSCRRRYTSARGGSRGPHPLPVSVFLL